jgi:hypothetical protein
MAEGTTEAGWEDLNANSIDTGEEDDLDLDESVDDSPAETETAEAATEVVEPETTEETTDDGTDSDQKETITLDGVTYEVPEGELGAAFKKAATHFNQVAHYQEIADKRQTQLEELQQNQQQLLNQFTAMQMAQEQQQQQQQHVAQQPQEEPRPHPEQLRGAFKPYLDALKEQGRLSEDEYEEHQGLISEYLYDSMRQAKAINDIAAYFEQRIQAIEGVAVPTYQSNQVREAQERDQSVWQDVAKLEGYEALADPEEWSRLKEYITNKVLNSKKDSQGNPLFDPIFDTETMAQQYDAMQGAIMRKALAEQKNIAEAAKKKAVGQAAGNAPGGGGAPQGRPKAKSPKEVTPESDALDWSDPTKAMG